MNCTNCGQTITDASLGFCTECGQLLEDLGGGVAADTSYSESYAYEEPSGAARASEKLAQVLEPVRGIAAQVGHVIQGVLEDPRLRSRLPGGSLTLLGVGLVGLALVLSVIPFVSGIGIIGSLVMLVGGALVAVNEWRFLSEVADPKEPLRPPPPALDNLPEPTQHPAIAWFYAALTGTFALLMLGYGFVSLVWLLAALVLGYEQGRRFFGPPRDPYEYDPDAGSLRQRLNGWVVAAAVLCSFSLLLPWSRGRAALSGGELPLATLTQLTLVVLACFALRRRGLAGMHPIVLVGMSGWLTFWFFLMMSAYSPGPWFFMPGLLALDAIIVLNVLPVPRGAQPEEPAPDADSRG